MGRGAWGPSAPAALQALQPLLQPVDLLCGLVESVELGKQGLEHGLEARGLGLPPWPQPAQAPTQRVQLAGGGGGP